MVEVLGSTVVFGVGNARFPVCCRPLTRVTISIAAGVRELGVGLGPGSSSSLARKTSSSRHLLVLGPVGLTSDVAVF